jgi:protein phosphatase-4 regulatory subunit 3
VNLQDEFYNQQMMQEHLFEPILNVVYETMPRDNLLNSACLELFDYIRRESIRALITHLVENYREKLKDIVYVDTFSGLITRYEQMQRPNDASFAETEVDTPERSQVSGGRRWQGVKDLDPAEEEYFNTSDDEDELLTKSPINRTTVNGASPLSKPLVDYPSDDEADMMETDLSAGILPDDSGTEEVTKSNEESADGISAIAPATPPERLSEKRRREEDEEDELGKLSLNHKRRNSSSASSVSSVSSTNSNSIRRKKSFTKGKDGGGTAPRRIAMNIPTAIKSSGEGNKGGEDGS